MPRTRRAFLQSSAFAAAAVALRPAWATPPLLANDPMRPQFHLLPASNWMNDPNGPIFFEGRYHMFFQYNPQAAVWGNMSWYHSVSPDMLHWKSLPLAFTPNPDGPDAAGCFSGSAIAVGEGKTKRVYALYTGVVKDKARETIRNEGLRESQCLAWSDDPLLRRWTRAPEPVVANPPPGLAVTGFRDPAVWKDGKYFYMTVGSGIEKTGGCVLLYRSEDLRQWEYLHPLTEGSWDGKPTSNPVADGEMWECPDFFALDGGHVLVYSTEGKVFWQSGHFDPQALRFTAKASGLLDLDAFYAPKTQLDAHGRRILWGWVPERRSEAEMTRAGWSGMMSLPRLLHLDRNGILRITALPEMVTLRAGSLPVTAADGGTLPRATGELLAGAAAGVPFTLQLQAGPDTLLTAAYSPERHEMRLNDHTVALQPGDVSSLRAWVDGSVLEVLVGERVAYTRRFYSSAPVAPDVRVTVTGKNTHLALWSIRAISPDRLTTSTPMENA